MSGQGDVRRSERSNKGVPPERLGDFAPAVSQRKKPDDNGQGTSRDDAASVHSSKSKMSSLSSRLKRQVDLNASQYIVELEDEQDEIDAQLLIEQKQIQADLRKKKIERKKNLERQRVEA